MRACTTALAVSSKLQQCAGRLAQAAKHQPLAHNLSGFIGELPPLGSSTTNRLSQAQVEAFAGLYYYGELEVAGVLSVAELVVEERYTLNLNDRSLFQAMEDMADTMQRGWYNGDRRSQLFATSLGFDTNNDFRRSIASLTDALHRYERETQYATSVTFAPVVAVEFAMGTILDEIARRGHLGLERAASALNSQLRLAVAILGNPALQRLFNARDMWSLIGAIISDPNGQAPAFSQIADRAESGAAMLGWIASHVNDIRARNGAIASQLQNDATLFRYATRWRMAAGNLMDSSGYAPGTGNAGGWQTSQPPYSSGSPGGFTGGWA